MEYVINERDFIIRLQGSKEEINKFAKCLVEIVNENLIEDFSYFMIRRIPRQFNLNSIQTMYVGEEIITYLPNSNEDDLKEKYFEVMKINYEKAKKSFLK